jgi:uncharacterized membrane protein
MNPPHPAAPLLTFPQPFEHNHPPVQNVNRLFDDRMSAGQRAADLVAAVMGSWRFIIIQSVVFAVWVGLNITAWMRHWDPYPFILMNLALSLQAAYAAPVIMMSQNRQAERDRLEAHNDYEVNKKAENEIRAVLEHLAAQDHALTEIHIILKEIRTGGPSSPRPA